MNVFTAPRITLALAVFSSLSLVACVAPTESDEAVGEAEQALSESECPDVMPAGLTPAADQNLVKEFDGVGVQIYSCNLTGTTYAWTFIAPEADLFRHDGNHRVGSHFAGPTWEAKDGSYVVGVKVASANSPDGAIPWLLLTAGSHGGPDGRFTDFTTIQRLDTVGGVAPATGCDAAHVGAVAEVPYSAHYFFYETKTHGHVHQCG